MNEFSEPERTVDPQLLDRLVDGELEGAQRRELLTTLERRAGWRQCALAFLEAQSWRDALAGYDGEPAEASTSPSPLMGEGRGEGSHAPLAEPALAASSAHRHVSASAEANATVAPSPPAHSQRHSSHWRSWLAMAASFLITLSLGMYIQHLWHPGEAPAASQAGIEAAAVQSVRQEQALPDTFVPPMEALQGQGPGAWSPAMPDGVREPLVQSNFRIQQERVYVPIQLANGQQVSVPIDRVKIVPAGSR